MSDSTSKDTTTDPSGPLDALKEKLKKAAEAAVELANKQADNKREQDDLKKAIEVFGKSVGEFKEGGKKLHEDYGKLLEAVRKDKNGLEEKHPDTTEHVNDAIKGVDETSTKTSKNLTDAEPKVAGAEDVIARKAKREEKKAQARFDEFAFGKLKDRVAEGKKLYDEAKKPAKLEDAKDLGRQYALLCLAEERLTWTWFQTDVGATSEEFHFPTDSADYETKLNAASAALLDAIKKAYDAAHAFKGTQDEYAADVKAFADLRKNRQADILKAAGEVAPEPTAPAADYKGKKATQARGSI